MPEAEELKTPGGGELEKSSGGDLETPGGGEVETSGGGVLNTSGGGVIETPGGGVLETPGGGVIETPGGGKLETPGGGELEVSKRREPGLDMLDTEPDNSGASLKCSPLPAVSQKRNVPGVIILTAVFPTCHFLVGLGGLIPLENILFLFSLVLVLSVQ